MKRCSRCREEKPLEAFSHDKSSIDGYASRCCECSRQMMDALRRSRGVKPRSYTVAGHGMKRCAMCKRVLPFSSFWHIHEGETSLAYSYGCMACQKRPKKLRSAPESKPKRVPPVAPTYDDPWFANIRERLLANRPR